LMGKVSVTGAVAGAVLVCMVPLPVRRVGEAEVCAN
jgi:hypothetical protein